MLSECLDANLVMNVPCPKQPCPLLVLVSVLLPHSAAPPSSSAIPSEETKCRVRQHHHYWWRLRFKISSCTILSTTTPSMCLPNCSNTANREDMTASLNVVFFPYPHCSSMTTTAVDVGRDCQRRKPQSIRTADRVNIEVGQD
jgi:hypothetical protein